MQKEIVSTENAPSAIGPYSQAIRLDNLIFISGQIPIEPSTGRLIDGDIQDQTRRVLENLQNVLSAGNSSLKNVLRTTIFLTDMDDYAAVNEAYAVYFDESQPARSTVQVSGLPMGAQVEVDAIAYVNTQENLLDA